MKQIRKQKYSWARWGVCTFLMGVGFVLNANEHQVEALEFQNSHLGTFDRKTTFITSSSTGIQPTLAIKVKNQEGSTQSYETLSRSLTISNTKEGATIKSAVLKGNTVVNIHKLNTPSLAAHESGWYENLVKKYGEISFDVLNTPTGWRYVNAGYLSYEMLKPDTKYLVAFNSAQNISSIHFMRGDGLRPLAPGIARVENNKAIITTNNEIVADEQILYINFHTKPNTKVSFSNPMIIEYQNGMETWDITHFTGTQSVQTSALTITNGEPEQIKNEAGQWVPNPAFQSTAIHFEEEVILRSKGDVYDELDLITGTLIQRLDENNNVLTKPIVRTVKLKAEPIFSPINQAEVSVVGDIDATIASVTLPTAPLSFKLNPNNAPEQQFIASEFSITNDSQAPLTIELKEFVQITDVLTDVAPDYYDEWKDLTKEESKKIALGLIPQKSENWLTLNPGTYYVAETSDEVLGRVRSRSTVDFKFTALHGQAFEKLPNPQYRLTFVFGF